MCDILIALTDRALRWRLIQHFRGQRLTVQGTTTGYDVVQLTNDPDLRLVVIADTLPDWSGLELCQLLRHRAPRLQIVFLTSTTATLDAFQAGANEVQPLSCDYPVLVARIAARLRRAWYDQHGG